MYGPIALPDLERLAAAFRYEPESGNLSFFRKGEWRLLTPTPGTRYMTVKFAGRRLYAHRIAWKLHYGSEPPDIIDHIDRDKSNNRICNLRAATVSLNNANRDVHGGSVKGFFYDRARGCFRARIRVQGRSKYLGYFKSAEDASAAYETAAHQHLNNSISSPGV